MILWGSKVTVYGHDDQGVISDGKILLFSTTLTKGPTQPHILHHR